MLFVYIFLDLYLKIIFELSNYSSKANGSKTNNIKETKDVRIKKENYITYSVSLLELFLLTSFFHTHIYIKYHSIYISERWL